MVWTCLVYDRSNYSSTLFDLHIETKNSFSLLEDQGDLSFDSVNSENMPNQPKATSSPVKPRPKPVCGPHPLRIININCQSLKTKRDHFIMFLTVLILMLSLQQRHGLIAVSMTLSTSIYISFKTSISLPTTAAQPPPKLCLPFIDDKALNITQVRPQVLGPG